MDNLGNDQANLDNLIETKHSKKGIIILIGGVLIIIVAIFVIILSSQSSKKDNDNPENIFGIINMSNWQYNSEDKVYYQLKISYCSKPKNSSYQNLGLFIPEAYLKCTKNGEKYKCEKNPEGKVKDYTTNSAPIVFPVETPGYSASKPLENYKSFKQYIEEGIIYMYPGCRGRDSGAPSGVVDLKASISYIRKNKDLIPGSMDKIFSFGMSGGGAQSCLIGITGDADEYKPYLEDIGAITNFSNSVYGSQCWCPITNLDSADMAYEWNLGDSRSGLTEEYQNFSNYLRNYYVKYINQAGFKDGNNNDLILDENNIYSGSYYDYVKTKIEESFNNWVKDTEFPYTPKEDPGPRNNIFLKNEISDVTYNTLNDYITYLNELISENWISYDNITNTSKITNISSFSKAVKKATKSIGAFDSINEKTGENELFGINGTSEHFDKYLYEIVKGTNYESVFKNDLEKKDYLGKTKEERVNMYTPLFYLMDSYKRNGSEFQPAKYFRINTGIFQSDTSVNTEINLALALANYKKTQIGVDFEMVWEKKHVKAERTNDSDTNFINWLKTK